MKNLMVLFFTMLLIFVSSGCSEKNEQYMSEPESLAGYMTIKDDKLYLDKVEIITLEDNEKIEALGLDPQANMPDGFYIYNEDMEKEIYELTDETEYIFVDFNLLFIKAADGDRLYTTNKKEEFLQHLEESYSDFPPAQKVPFFIKIKEGKVISVTEKFEFTI